MPTKSKRPAPMEMLTKLHPDAATILARQGLLACNAEMEKNIGRHVAYRNWEPSMGTCCRDFTFTIIGVQKNYRGDLVYRVLCDGYADTFGRCASPNEVEFV